MKTLIKNVRLVYPGHKLNGSSISLLTDGQTILSIGNNASGFDREIDASGMLLFPGLIDLQCHSGEPGNEDKEDFNSLTMAAKVGGYSGLFLLPNTSPVVDSKSEVSYVNQMSAMNGVKLYPLGAISKGLKGTELSEMYDMHMAGAMGFSDAKNPVRDVNMMKRALHYVKNFGGTICSFPNDERLAPGGLVNESASNTSLGLKSSPALAEEIMLNRDLYLLAYSQSKLHVATVSTAGSVSLVAEAKSKGLNVSAGVAMANILFNDQVLQSFETHYKVNPPLREESDRLALIQGLKHGSIDVLVSDHTPEVIENKDVEFDQAANGITMLETLLSAYNTHLSTELSWDELIQCAAINPRKLFRLPLPELATNQPFEFTLFNPSQKWRYDQNTCVSKANNSPFFGHDLMGRVVVID